MDAPELPPPSSREIPGYTWYVVWSFPQASNGKQFSPITRAPLASSRERPAKRKASATTGQGLPMRTVGCWMDRLSVSLSLCLSVSVSLSLCLSLSFSEVSLSLCLSVSVYQSFGPAYSTYGMENSPYTT